MHQADLKKVQAERDRVAAQETVEQDASKAVYLTEQRTLLEKLIPEFKDVKTGKPLRDKLYEYALQNNVAVEEMDRLADSRIINFIDKARRWDESQANVKKVTKEKKREGLPTLTPGARVPREKPGKKRATNARTRLAETGSIRDATSALMDMED